MISVDSPELWSGVKIDRLPSQGGGFAHGVAGRGQHATIFEDALAIFFMLACTGTDTWCLHLCTCRFSLCNIAPLKGLGDFLPVPGLQTCRPYGAFPAGTSHSAKTYRVWLPRRSLSILISQVSRLKSHQEKISFSFCSFTARSTASGAGLWPSHSQLL